MANPVAPIVGGRATRPLSTVYVCALAAPGKPRFVVSAQRRSPAEIPVAQSLSRKQARPATQGPQVPPQSTSLSVPSSVPLLHRLASLAALLPDEQASGTTIAKAARTRTAEPREALPATEREGGMAGILAPRHLRGPCSYRDTSPTRPDEGSLFSVRRPWWRILTAVCPCRSLLHTSGPRS